MENTTCLMGDGKPVAHKGLCRAHYMEQWRATTMVTFRHGTLNGYNNHRCRCDLCREVKSAADLRVGSHVKKASHE